MTALLWPQRYQLEGLVQTDILGTLLIIRSLSLNMLATVVAILFLVAAADYLFQYRQWFERQKMSLQRDEGRVQADRRRSAGQGQDPPVAPGPACESA